VFLEGAVAVSDMIFHGCVEGSRPACVLHGAAVALEIMHQLEADSTFPAASAAEHNKNRPFGISDALHGQFYLSPDGLLCTAQCEDRVLSLGQGDRIQQWGIADADPLHDCFRIPPAALR
jgi:hypothetical protein